MINKNIIQLTQYFNTKNYCIKIHFIKNKHSNKTTAYVLKISMKARMQYRVGCYNKAHEVKILLKAVLHLVKIYK